MAFAAEDAGRVEHRFDKTPDPRATPQPLVFPLQEQLPPEQASGIRFTLKAIRLHGNTAFSSEQLNPLYAPLIGREISVLDLYKLRDALTAHYGKAGFGLSKALIPEQRIESNGIVQIDLIEGFVDEVVIEGGTTLQQRYLAYAAEQIKAERPLKAQTLERYLLLANDRFAIKVTSTLKKSERTPNASTLILKVEPAPKVEGSLGVDNRGTQAVGPTQFNANLALNGLGGMASQTTFNYITSEQPSELQYFALSHTELLSREGTSLTFGYSNSTAKPGIAALRLLDNRSDSRSFSLKLAHPFMRTRQQNLTAHVKYEQKDIEGRSLNALTLQDKLHSVRLGINYDHADGYDGVNQALVEYSKGIVGGASAYNQPLKSRADGRTDYQKLTFNLSRNQQLGYFLPNLSPFSLNLALMGQMSDGGLLSSEECGLGGQQFGRAFDASEILGDRCAAASAELRYSPNTGNTPFQYAQFYSFYDIGYTANVNPVAAADPLVKSLASAGAGVRFGIAQAITGSIEAAQPFNRNVANQGNRNARVFATLSVRF